MKFPAIMSLRFYNTLSQRVEEFHPARDNTVRLYTCGPTVYSYAHIATSAPSPSSTFCGGGCEPAVTAWIT